LYKKYIEQGLAIFPCNQDKTPKTSNGVYGAHTDWQSWNGSLIGLATGNKNKLVVLDFDVYKSGISFEDMRESLEEFGPLPDTFTVETMSGGRHLYFAVEKTKITTGSWFFGKHIPIDIRGNGGYVIAPDDEKYFVIDDTIDNLLSKCAPLPEWVENFKKQKQEVTEKNLILPESERKELRSALNYIPSDDRNTWVNFGMALKNTGCKSARGLWDEWSQKSDKYDPKDQQKKWQTFKPSDITIATILFEAKKYGWETTYQKEIEIIEPEKEKNKIQKKYFPEELLQPPGIVGELVEYINSKSIKEQPVLALGAALAALGTLQGRKIQTETRIRTNIYCIGVGESGSGKEAARKTIKELFHYINCGHMAAVEDLASDSAIVTCLEGSPSQIFLLDEMGRFLKVTNTDSKNPHLYNIISVLLKLYSSSDQIFYGKSYANKDNNKRIDCPNLCIYGTTVPAMLYNGLTVDNIIDGFLSRVLLFESENPDPGKDRTKDFLRSPSKNLLEKLKTIRDMPTNFEHGINIKPRVVFMTDEACEILHSFDEEIKKFREELRNQNQYDNIYNRTAQTAEQIALIIAGGVNIDDPIITKNEIEYGIKLSKYLSDNLLYIIDNFISENEIEASVKKIYNLIKNNNGISMSEITRKSQGLPGYKRNDILETLIQGGKIIVNYEGTGKRKKKTFYIA